MSSIIRKMKLGSGSESDEINSGHEKVSSTFFNKEDEKILRTLAFEEQVVYKTQKLYRDPDNGLCALFRALDGPEPVVPERKINVLIIGNHSSGKSTFINWYVGENVQKTGVAMETSKFTIVCHGKRRETLTAGSIVKLFPQLEVFENLPGVMDHLSGEVSTCSAHRFRLVNFIDSPGIVDGERYNFDFDRTLEICAEMADLIFVFFDPHGQALCQRTLTHLERLCSSQPSKLSLWMTKCDMVEGERDLVKVTQQISRELARRPIIARQELWLTPIYVPGHSDNQPAGLNHLSAAEALIDKSIVANLQSKVLRNIAQQCDQLEALNAEKLAQQESRRSRRFSNIFWLRLFLYLTIMSAVITIGVFVVDDEYLAESLKNIVDPPLVVDMKTLLHKSLTKHIQPQMEMPVLAGVLFCISVLAWLGAREPTEAAPDEAVKNDEHTTRPWYRNNINRINDIRHEAKQIFDDYLNLTLDA